MIKKAPDRFRGIKKGKTKEKFSMSKKDKTKNQNSQAFYFLQYYLCICRLPRVLNFINRLKFKNINNKINIGEL